MFSGLVFLVLGGLMAMAIRFQPRLALAPDARPSWMFPRDRRRDHARVLHDAVHHARHDHDLLRDHPAADGAFGNFLIPLMVGAPDMASRSSTCSVLGDDPGLLLHPGPASSPRVARPRRLDELPAAVDDRERRRRAACTASSADKTLWLLALTFVGLSSMMGAVNYVTTIVKMRAPGMTLMRMPLSVWV